MTFLRYPGAALFLAAIVASASPALITFNDDGGWNWLQDKRAVVADGHLYVASVATGFADPSRTGAAEVVSYDLATGELHRSTLHRPEGAKEIKAWKDDHTSPALFARPDGRILAVYSRHSADGKFYSQIFTPGNPGSWSGEKVFTLPQGSRVACANLQYLSGENGGRGRLFSFYRGLNGENLPSWACSDDLGETWSSGGVAIATVMTKADTLPYAKYAGNGTDTIHLVYGLGHQESFHNTLWHIYYRQGGFFRSDGTPIGTLAKGRVPAADGTPIFQAGPQDIAWISDVEVGPDGNPAVAYSVQKNTPDLKNRGDDHRYRYARWTGSTWSDHEIAHAGGRLHPVPDDTCTGLISIDPQDTHRVFISTDADPVSGRPLISTADASRHWEIFEGMTADGGATWSWIPVTHDSVADNIRPILPTGSGSKRIVLWLRGSMRMPNDYNLSVVGLISDRGSNGN